ncbi:hypothetical protein A6M14_00220 [Acinetobacter sp. Ac_877]|uniref:hypothetical protein n=1 Tax=Acinetobacter portensis TaxID=1839785 RepID=UPI00128E24FB|nr:hypothetical protein [Acinetobacter portensis]MPW41086.1 hypothetical protein [Acinetobacter portensis]
MNSPFYRSIVVRELAGNRASVTTFDLELIIQLERIGFKVDEYENFSLEIIDESHCIDIINTLIDLEALFSVGRDWSPEELVLYYREIGKIDRSFKVISWKNNNNYSVQIR